MPYALTRSELSSITDPELAFGTTRLLPKLEDIPPEFNENFGAKNLYVQLVNSLMFGHEMPNVMMEFKAGFEDEQAPSDLNKCVRSHLQSHSPKHEHKAAGVAFLIACVCELHPS